MNIAVFFGGKSSEHDISIITAVQAMRALDKEKYKVVPIYITKEGKWLTGKKLYNAETFVNFEEKGLKEISLGFGKGKLLQKRFWAFKEVLSIDCALLCDHGLNGEDGTLQGALELAEIPYTSSAVLGSAVCMDKIIMKQLFQQNGFPVPYVWLTREEFETNEEEILDRISSELTYPLIVKPANLGSSIGISRCENEEELISAIEVACKYDGRIIVENAIIALKEINCACLGYGEDIEISKLEEPISWHKLLTFKDKYLTFSKSRTSTEPKISKELKLQIQSLTVKAFKTLSCSGVVRVDFLLDSESSEIYINEINSIPGSLANYLFSDHFGKLLDRLIEIGIKKFEDKKKNKLSYKSTALFEFVRNGKKGFLKK